MPRWLIRGLLNQVVARVVRAGIQGRLGRPRTLLRSVGMGGTASILLWNMGYGPVFTAVELATGTLVPSYVDDGEILAYGPRQAVASLLMLMVAVIALVCWPSATAVLGLRPRVRLMVRRRLRRSCRPLS